MKVSLVIMLTGPVLQVIDTHYNNSEKPSTTKVNKHTACGYSLFINFSFDSNKNKHDYKKGENCTKNFCKKLKECATEIINFGKEVNVTINKRREKSYYKQRIYYIYKKEFIYDDEKCYKFKITVIIPGNIEAQHVISVI